MTTVRGHFDDTVLFEGAISGEQTLTRGASSDIVFIAPDGDRLEIKARYSDPIGWVFQLEHCGDQAEWPIHFVSDADGDVAVMIVHPVGTVARCNNEPVAVMPSHVCIRIDDLETDGEAFESAVTERVREALHPSMMQES